MEKGEIPVFCYSNGCTKYGPDGIYYEGSNPRVIRVKRKTDLNRLLDQLCIITRLDKERSKLEIIGRYPSVVQQSMVKYVGLPVLNDKRLKLMLEIPIIHACINNVELYLNVKETSSPLENLMSSSKRQKTLQPSCHRHDILARNACLDDHQFCVGLCFKDKVELKKAVDWCSIEGQRKCVFRECEKDVCTFECIRWKCNWSLCAARVEEHGCFEITKYRGPHTCCPQQPCDVMQEFGKDEIERTFRIQPTLSAAELRKWWKEKTSHGFTIPEMETMKRIAIEKILGFRVVPKLMAALQSSNGLLVDWQYDHFPNPAFASFRGVFWAFSQSIEGFKHCRPLIVVDSKHLNGKYPMELMIASGIDAADKYFPLAFAVSKEVSSDSWRWFFTQIREKVTQRKGICLITSLHPDIFAVINEPGSRCQEPWAYHRFCLNHLQSQSDGIFKLPICGTLLTRLDPRARRNNLIPT